MIKKFILALVCFFISGSIFVPIVSAHVLKTDGSIGALLHIDPEDDPIAAQQAGFFFEFKDKQGKFTPDNCDCTFSIIEQGKQLYSQPLFQDNTNPNLENASLFYTFPQRDVYQVVITGKPLTPNAFQPFTLTYDIRVSRQASTTANASPSTNTFATLNDQLGGHLPHYIGLLVIVVVFVFFIFIDRRNRRIKELNRQSSNAKTLSCWIVVFAMATVSLHAICGEIVDAKGLTPLQSQQSHTCCLTQAPTIVGSVIVEPTLVAFTTIKSPEIRQLPKAIIALDKNRSPPAFT